MFSQEVLSHFYVFHSLMKNWVLGSAYGTGAITHEWNTLIVHSVISASLVDCAAEVCLQEDQQTREDPIK
jgi:hypothetical protein